MKFMPYDGFYPAQRSTQLVKFFKESYEDNIRTNSVSTGISFLLGGAGSSEDGSPRPIYQTLFAPGILFNTIKSGMAVDYPVVLGPDRYTARKLIKGSATNATDYHLGEIVGNAWFENGRFSSRIPFDAILKPENYIKDVEIRDNEIHPSSSVGLTASLGDPINTKYNLAAQNFFGAVEEFFLEPLQNQEISSKRFNITENNKVTLEADTTYAARVILKRSMTGVKDYSNDAFGPGEPDTGFLNNFVVNGAVNPNQDFAVYSIPQDPKFSSDYRETFTMYSRPSAFGPPMSGRRTSISTTYSGSLYLSKSVSDSLNGFNWAYTPPYYDGEAWMDIILRTPASTTGLVQLTIDEIQSKSSYIYRRVDPGIKPLTASYSQTPRDGELIHSGLLRGTARTLPYASEQINSNAMQISASFIVDGLRSSTSQGIVSQQWVIRPKFLTPMLNFNHLASSDSITTSSYGTETIPRGMWHQFGHIPTTNEGITVTIDDIPKSWLNSHYDFKDVNTAYNNFHTGSVAAFGVKSLVDVLQFDREPKKLGLLKDKKEIFEGIVAIPYVASYEAGGTTLLKYSQEEIRDSLQKFDENFKYSDSIIKTISFLRKFVVPKDFDALNAPLRDATAQLIAGTSPVLGLGQAELYKFFFFEFSATLSKNDLSYIWQNLLPRDFEEGVDGRVLYTPDYKSKIADITERKRIKLTDRLEITDPALLEALNTNRLKWHIFKVKQRGVFSFSTDREMPFESDNYIQNVVDFGASSNSLQRFKIRTDDLTFVSNPKQGFNWPYDFFSLTEKIKINAKVKFRNKG